MANLDLCLVRHGSTDWTEQSRFCGWSDIGLSSLGKLEVESLKKNIDPNFFDMVFSSDLSRCLETADIIGSNPQVDSRLREVFFGKFEGLTWKELDDDERKVFLDVENFRFPAGESHSDYKYSYYKWNTLFFRRWKRPFDYSRRSYKAYSKSLR